MTTRHRARPGRLAALAPGLLLAAMLGACSGPPAAAPPAVTSEAGPLTPTPLGTGLETPLQSQAPGPAITMAAPTAGFAEDTSPGHVCLHFAWESGVGVPQLTNGMAFVVGSVHVSPPALAPADTGCGTDVAAAAQVSPTPVRVPACLGTTLTPGQLQCVAPMVRVPAYAGQSAAATLLGHLVCNPPVTAEQCARTQAELVRAGAQHPIEIPAAPAKGLGTAPPTGTPTGSPTGSPPGSSSQSPTLPGKLGTLQGRLPAPPPTSAAPPG